MKIRMPVRPAPISNAYPVDDPMAQVRANDLLVIDITGEDQLPRELNAVRPSTTTMMPSMTIAETSVMEFKAEGHFSNRLPSIAMVLSSPTGSFHAK